MGKIYLNLSEIYHFKVDFRKVQAYFYKKHLHIPNKNTIFVAKTKSLGIC